MIRGRLREEGAGEVDTKQCLSVPVEKKVLIRWGYAFTLQEYNISLALTAGFVMNPFLFPCQDRNEDYRSSSNDILIFGS